MADRKGAATLALARGRRRILSVTPSPAYKPRVGTHPRLPAGSGWPLRAARRFADRPERMAQRLAPGAGASAGGCAAAAAIVGSARRSGPFGASGRLSDVESGCAPSLHQQLRAAGRQGGAGGCSLGSRAAPSGALCSDSVEARLRPSSAYRRARGISRSDGGLAGGGAGDCPQKSVPVPPRVRATHPHPPWDRACSAPRRQDPAAGRRGSTALGGAGPALESSHHCQGRSRWLASTRPPPRSTTRRLAGSRTRPNESRHVGRHRRRAAHGGGGPGP
jgi:hypothetical protein